MGERLAAAALFVGLSVSVAAVAALGLTPSGVGVALPGLAAAGVWAGVFASSTHTQRSKLVAASVVMVLYLGFCVGALRVAALALALGNIELGPGTPVLLSAGMLLPTALLALMWAGLGRRALEPSAAAKSSIAYVGLALGCLCLATGLEWARDAGPIASIASIASLAALLLGHAIAGPDCLRTLLACVPKRMHAAGLASWVLALVCAQALAHASVPAQEPTLAFSVCLSLGFAALAAAVLCSFIWRPTLTLALPHDDGPSDTLAHRPTRELDATL